MKDNSACAHKCHRQKNNFALTKTGLTTAAAGEIGNVFGLHDLAK